MKLMEITPTGTIITCQACSKYQGNGVDVITDLNVLLGCEVCASNFYANNELEMKYDRDRCVNDTLFTLGL